MLAILVVSLILLACRSQKLNSNIKNEDSRSTLSKLDIKKIQEFSFSESASYIQGDGMSVELMKSTNTYQVTKQMPNSPFKQSYEYYKSSLTVKGGGVFFYNFPIGVFREYDEMGNVTNEINYDTLCDFSIEALIKKFKKEFKINLMNPIDGLSIQRYQEASSKISEYTIKYPIDDYSFRYIRINCDTEQVVSDSMGHYIE